MEKIKVRLTLTEDLLGTASGNKELYADYIATTATALLSSAQLRHCGATRSGAKELHG